MALSFKKEVIEKILDPETVLPFFSDPEASSVKITKAYDRLLELPLPVTREQVIGILEEYGLHWGPWSVIDSLQKATNSR